MKFVKVLLYNLSCFCSLSNTNLNHSWYLSVTPNTHSNAKDTTYAVPIKKYAKLNTKYTNQSPKHQLFQYWFRLFCCRAVFYKLKNALMLKNYKYQVWPELILKESFDVAPAKINSPRYSFHQVWCFWDSRLNFVKKINTLTIYLSAANCLTWTWTLRIHYPTSWVKF